jgi:hypothetical protein
MNLDKDYFSCRQCKQPAGRLYVEWSTEETVEDPAERSELKRDGCIAEMFCSWECAGRWFHTQAGRRDLHSQE